MVSPLIKKKKEKKKLNNIIIFKEHKRNKMNEFKKN